MNSSMQNRSVSTVRTNAASTSQVPPSLKRQRASTEQSATQGGIKTPDAAENDDFVECSVCLEPMHTPVTLPCGHTFCETCVNQLIKTKAIVCPQCRSKARVPPGGLRKNIVLQQLIETELKRRHAVPLPPAATTTSSPVDDEEDNKSACSICKQPVVDVDRVCCTQCHASGAGSELLYLPMGVCMKCFMLKHNGHSWMSMRDARALTQRQWTQQINEKLLPNMAAIEVRRQQIEEQMVPAIALCAELSVQLNATADDFAREMRREINAAKASREVAFIAAHGKHKLQALGDNVLWMSMDGCDSVGFRTACTLLDKAIVDTHTVLQPVAVSASAERAAVFGRFLQDIQRQIQIFVLGDMCVFFMFSYNFTECSYRLEIPSDD